MMAESDPGVSPYAPVRQPQRRASPLGCQGKAAGLFHHFHRRLCCERVVESVRYGACEIYRLQAARPLAGRNEMAAPPFALLRQFRVAKRSQQVDRKASLDDYPTARN